MPDIASVYLDEVRRNLRGHKRLAEGAFEQLRDEDFFHQLDPEANSIAIIVKHIAGNMRSRFTDFLSSDGEKPDRHRDQEFIIDSGTTRAHLLDFWAREWEQLFKTLDALKPEDLERVVTIRGQAHSVVQALNRALAHYAYHIGQIVLLAKHARGAEWKSLSVPKGKSEEFNAQMLERASSQGKAPSGKQ